MKEKEKKIVNAIFGHDTWKQLRNDNKTTNWRDQDAMISIATYEKSGGGEMHWKMDGQQFLLRILCNNI